VQEGGLQEGMVKMPLEKDKRMQQQQNVAVADTASRRFVSFNFEIYAHGCKDIFNEISPG